MKADNKQKINHISDNTSLGWLVALGIYDYPTWKHSRRVAEIASSLAGLRKVKDEVKKYIWYRALLHDIGEICIPQKLLQKPASRSDQEWKLMRRHLISEFSRFTTNLSRNNMRIKIYLIEIKKSRFSHRGSFINLPIFQETTVSASTIW